jgi:hypothetical protein
METPMPLNKVILDTAKQLGVKKIILHFSGGSDEGFLNVDLVPYPDKGEGRAFADDVEDWAWGAYGYSGAGEGYDYGDDITYDLETNRVSVHDWCMDRVEGGTETSEMEVEEDDK